MTPENEALIAEAEAWFYVPSGDAAALKSYVIATKLITALRAADEREQELREALTLFAELGDKFKGPVVEVCQPNPNNPSSTIVPFYTEHFTTARKVLRGKS